MTPLPPPHSAAASARSIRVEFPGHAGTLLAARLDIPVGKVRAFALFAHCFTCTKDILAAKSIAGELAQAGIAVLRFDFTGLGASAGEFANTNFSSNVDDLVGAADFLRQTYEAPALLIGHSLGGAAILAAAHRIAEARAVVTIGAPADVAHVLHNFGSSLGEIEEKGEAVVQLAGRPFRIARSFVEDARMQRLDALVANLDRALLIMHSPFDATVGIENAARLYAAAKHPKSFVSLVDADHLISRRSDAAYAARLIAAWVDRYLPGEQPTAAVATEPETIIVSETGTGTYQTSVLAGRHRLLADEPVAAGGLDTGPSPYDYLSVALGACTAMTLRVYAAHKRIDLPRITVEVRHGKVAAEHCIDCGAAVEGRTGAIDRFERVISVNGGVSPELAAKLTEIADKCPVHKTLTRGAAVVTRVG